MNIINCSNCSQYVHSGESFGEVCIYCGTVLTVRPEKDNGLLVDIIHNCESELQSGNFNLAVKMYDDSINKFPKISMLYWGRYLALHRCKNDLELIINGIGFNNDSDFINASRFANDAEKECYNALAKTREAIARSVLDSLESSQNAALIDTDVSNMNKKATSEINDLQNTVTKQISELDLVEKSIRDKVADCDVLIRAGKSRINYFIPKLIALKGKISTLNEATYDETENYTTEMSLSLSVCTNEWRDMQPLTQKPQFVEYNSLLKKQKEAERAVNNTIKQINEVNERLSRLIGTITSIKARYAEARTEIQNGSFAKAKVLLRNDVFEQILRKFVRV